MTSAYKWKAHTSTEKFATEFDQITKDFAKDNELRTKKVEDFLIAEAKKAGVVKSTRDRIHKNPNRWAKHLAPWFDEACKQTKYTYR
jgi:hypothetical protein